MVVTLIALAVAAGAAALAGCGEEDAELLPGGTANEINANLDTVKRLSDEGDCLGAESAAEQVGEQVEGLGGIDPELKRALEEGAERLNEVVDRCEEEAAAAPDEEAEEEGDEEGLEEEDRRKEEEQQRKEEEREQKEQEKEERESEKAEKDEGDSDDGDESEGGPPESAPPPQAPPAEDGSPSGGVEPAAPVEGEDD